MEAFLNHRGQSLPEPAAVTGFRRGAVIDVGTNSVKLLVADVAGGRVEPVWEGSEQTRLGTGFYESHCLQPEAIGHTARAVGAFAAKARELGVSSLRVIATSAARDATNREDLITALEASGGAKVDVITGDQEAEWAYSGVTSDPALAGKPLLIVDLGGGSTEFILGDAQGVHFCRSFPLGSVRLLEKVTPGDPPSAAELDAVYSEVKGTLKGLVAPAIRPALTAMSVRPARLIATGGAASILARMELAMTDFDRTRIESVRFSGEKVRDWLIRLWGLPLAERKRIPGLPSNRADVILCGVCIFAAILETIGISELAVSTRGLRFGALLDMP